MERFWNKVDKNGSCWIWTGCKNPMGYGRIRYGKRYKFAHRVIYAFMNGTIPDGKMICHICDNPSCVNPAHLFAGTQFDNMRDCVERNRNFNTKKTHCKKGHPFNKENTKVTKTGSRMCIACDRIHNRTRIQSWRHV